MRSDTVRTAVLALALLFPAPPVAASSAGLAYYMQRRDGEALRALADAERLGELGHLGRLALADLHMMTGSHARAGRLLAALASDGFAPEEVSVWVAWIDFARGRRHGAQEALAELGRTAGDSRAAVRALWSLGWQQLIDGRGGDAAETFASLQARSLPTEVAEQVPLLLGQSLMWLRRWDAAEVALRSVGAPRLRGDAARDLAWIAYERGDVEGARAELSALAGSDDAGSARLVVPWSTVLHHGPRRLARALFEAYRSRPRGQEIHSFLLSLADRNAAIDARAILATLPRTRGRARSDHHEDRGFVPLGADVTDHQPPVAAPFVARQPLPRAGALRRQAAGAHVVPVALLVLVGVYLRRRRKRGH